jgi:hypothetical protein
MILSMVMATPWYRAWEKQCWEERVSNTLGIDVRADSFRWTAPHQFYATQVAIRHPETGALMGRIDRIDGLMKSHGWSVILDAPAIDGDQLHHGIDVIHDWFLCRPQKSNQLLAMAIPNGMTIHHGPAKTDLDRIEIVFRPTSSVSAVQVKWSHADQPFGEVSLHVSREHAAMGSSTKLELSSPNTWLPCAIANDRLPDLGVFGPNARFRGVVHYQANHQTWDARIQGEIQGVDYSVLTSRLGSPIRSNGAMVFEQLNVRDGRILLASGEFRAQSGTVSRTWLQNASQQLKLPAHLQPDATDSFGIEQLGFRFALDPSGWSMRGTLPGPANWPPVAARLGSSVLCADSTKSSLSQLVLALQPPALGNTGDVVALDAHTAALTAILPWPKVLDADRNGSAAANSLRARLSRSDEPTNR